MNSMMIRSLLDWCGLLLSSGYLWEYHYPHFYLDSWGSRGWSGPCRFSYDGVAYSVSFRSSRLPFAKWCHHLLFSYLIYASSITGQIGQLLFLWHTVAGWWSLDLLVAVSIGVVKVLTMVVLVDFLLRTLTF